MSERTLPCRAEQKSVRALAYLLAQPDVLGNAPDAVARCLVLSIRSRPTARLFDRRRPSLIVSIVTQIAAVFNAFCKNSVLTFSHEMSIFSQNIVFYVNILTLSSTMPRAVCSAPPHRKTDPLRIRSFVNIVGVHIRRAFAALRRLSVSRSISPPLCRRDDKHIAARRETIGRAAPEPLRCEATPSPAQICRQRGLCGCGWGRIRSRRRRRQAPAYRCNLWRRSNRRRSS